MPKKNGTSASFKTALSELEQIVTRLEDGDLPLGEALNEFRRGVQLMRQGRVKLQRAEQRVQVLLPNTEDAALTPLTPNNEQMDFMQQLQACVERANQALSRFVVPLSFQSTPVVETMQYGALLGGKRLRPFLVYATGQMFGVSLSTLDAPAIAVECIHAYSLVHDDLPAMDDDNPRHGLPTCHVKFGEASVILTGDALQTLAFFIISGALVSEVTDRDRIAMISGLTRASDIADTCDGQALDPEAEGHQAGLGTLGRIHRHKTGALTRVAVHLGVLNIGDKRRECLPILDKYAESIGLVFQVRDGILDVIGDTAALSRRRGADQQLGKSTYPALLGLEQAQNKARDLIEGARRSLSLLVVQSLDTSALEALADYAVQCSK